MLSILEVATHWPFSVIISELSSISSVSNLILSGSVQSCTATLQFSLFSTAVLPTQRGQEMPTRQLYSVLTKSSRQTVKCTPGEYTQVSDNTVSVTSTLPRGICSRDMYLTVSGLSMHSVFV